MIILHYYWLDLINHNYFILSTILDLFSDNILLIGTEKNVFICENIYLPIHLPTHLGILGIRKIFTEQLFHGQNAFCGILNHEMEGTCIILIIVPF